MFHAFRSSRDLARVGALALALFGAGAVTTGAGTGCGSSEASGAGAVVRATGAEARALVASGATLLDVRSQEEFDARHLEGATLIPVDQLEGRIAEVPRDHPVVVYCQSGGRSASAARMLAAAGHDVHDLGGIGNW